MKWSWSYGTGIASGAHFKALGKGGKHGKFSFALPFSLPKLALVNNVFIHSLQMADFYSNDSIMEFSNREFSFMETSFPEIFCQGFFFHGKFFSWNFPFHEIKIFPGIFLIMENSFHGICFHSIFFLKFSFMEKKFMENSCSHFGDWFWPKRR